jgi:hypothetical protein
LPTANDRAIVTRTCSSPGMRPGSLGGDPIIKVPAGATTISGHIGQGLPSASGSRKVLPEPGVTDSAGSGGASALPFRSLGGIGVF